MARPRGISKTGGRKRGTPNARTVMLGEALAILECDVPKRLVELLPRLEPDKQADVLLELMKYLYPKRTDIGSGDNSPNHIIQDNRKQLLLVMTDPLMKNAARLIAEKMACANINE
ncbi:MAG: hypothetical protein A2Z20_08960 [Bdellovibrionales bacterium RBG_16_40_8]|nr:MAG: hypothetical protein A2Z20_08960 [Bdellovibrionales bacterium RBG_16_40_8]